MEQTDTIELLKECDAGTKMAVSAIDAVLDKIQDQKMLKRIKESKDHHTELGNEIHSMLLRNASDDKEPNPIAKGMAWIKTNWKMGMNDTDATIADLITDGCNMGIKSLNKYLNQYKAANEESKVLCNQLIEIEERLAYDLRCYL